ncbi:MAG TPA: sensor histidine kinase [Chitinophagaceae bacterium]|nr:sensor histidine kinase [Chitinophagaceae bacterium]
MEMLNPSTKSKLINLLSHLAGWIIFFSLIIGFISRSPGNDSFVISKIFSPPFLIFSFTFLSLFYLNYFILIPQLYLKKKYLVYIISILAFFILVYYVQPFDRLMTMNPPVNRQHFTEEREMRPPPPGQQGGKPRNRDINSIILFVTVWSMSTAIPIIRQWRLAEKKALEAEAEKVSAELSFLKSQINPHFLFNTLNNIYSMALTKNENTAPSIMKLSNIMRYVTDDAAEDFVLLESEIDCIKDYIDLQRLRSGKKTNVILELNNNVKEAKIPPLILMTFVENAFKYGISNHEASEIVMRISSGNNVISFFCQNKLFESKKNIERNGIGISNAKRRLQHLYPDKYSLEIARDNGLFTVELRLQT